MVIFKTILYLIGNLSIPRYPLMTANSNNNEKLSLVISNISLTVELDNSKTVQCLQKTYGDALLENPAK